MVVLFLITGISSASDSQGTQSLLPAANFSYIVNGDWVYFTDLTVNTYCDIWNFGDGSTLARTYPLGNNATANNSTISHKYSNGGTYIVKLAAYNSNGYNSISRRINIVYQ